jgi:2-oxoglutarate/2-oxoacid ferredoxin oxidoreductase subunit alpha
VEVMNRRQPTVPPDWYVPYKTDGSLIPNLADLGQGYRYHVTGMTHDERGFPTRRADEANPFYARLFGKISRQFAYIEQVKPFELDDAEILIIAYGCTARSARAAVRLGRERGMKVGLLQLMSIWPFPRRAVTHAMTDMKAVLIAELNLGQLKREVLRVNDGRTHVLGLNKMDGTMITPEEILNRLREAK